MVKQQRRTDRCFLPAAGNSVAQVRFPAGPIQRRPPSLLQQGSGRQWACSGTGSAHSWPHCSSSTTTEEERGTTQGALGPDGGSGETKRARLDGVAELSALVPTSCDQTANESSLTPDGVSCRVPPIDQLGAAGLSEDSRAAESVGSLKVTILRSSESRAFGQTDRTAETQTGGLHCHVCNLTCRSVQVFHEHMSGAEHMKKLQEITHSIGLNTHTKQDRGLRSHTQRWCDSCQTHFSGDVIVHRQTKHHKMCKQLCRPFCPVCKRHFRTPRKFVEHMKSPEHKQKVHQQEALEDELITVDAVGCFEGEKEEVEVEVEEEEEEEEEEGDGKNEAADEKVLEAADTGDYNPHTTYGSSFVVPVSGFLCQLCNKFFQRETTARHTHCRTRTHYLNLQRSQKKPEDEDTPAVTGPAHTVSHHAPVL